jgi:hypothetical protein
MSTIHTVAAQKVDHFVYLCAGRVSERDVPAIFRAFEELVDFLNTNFPAPDKERDHAPAMAFLEAQPPMAAAEILDHLHDNPPTIPDGVWPVYVMRLLMRDVRLPVGILGGKVMNDWALRWVEVVC